MIKPFFVNKSAKCLVVGKLNFGLYSYPKS